jgi:hypothetical protein
MRRTKRGRGFSREGPRRHRTDESGRHARRGEARAGKKVGIGRFRIPLPTPSPPPSSERKKKNYQQVRTCNPMPALRIGSATCATALATRRHVDTTPTTGANGNIALTTLGKNLFNVMPTAMGARTTYSFMHTCMRVNECVRCVYSRCHGVRNAGSRRGHVRPGARISTNRMGRGGVGERWTATPTSHPPPSPSLPPSPRAKRTHAKELT